MSPRIAALLSLPLLFTTISTPLQAQGKLDRDISFVRALATKLRFISLAQAEVDRMKQRYKDGEDFQNVAQLGIEISLIGAKRHPNREERRTLYQDALERCNQFLERYPEGASALSAQMTQSDAALEFGRFLADEIDIARVEAPGKITDLEDQAAEVFRGGVEACEKVMAALEDKAAEDPRARADRGVTWMRKGILLREHARAVRKDREYLAERSRETLEEMIFEYGEDSLLGLRALFESYQNDEVLNQTDDAVQGYRDVIDNLDKQLFSEEIQFSAEAREIMVVMMEEAYDRIAATQFQAGRTDAVLTTMAAYREHLGKLDVPLTDLSDPTATEGKEDRRFGHSLYLTSARAMSEAGTDVSQALTLVQYFNDVHQNDFIGLRAKAALKEILSARSQRVSSRLLLEVAKGDFQAKDYETAVGGAKRAIASMSADEARTVGLEAYYLMGQAMAIEGRVLEATLAITEGLEKHGAVTEDGAIKERATSYVQRTMRQLRSNAQNDSYYDPLANRVADLAAQYGSVADASKRAYSEGTRLLSENKFDEAVGYFNRVAQDSLYFELAQMRVVTTLQRKRDYAGAREAIAKYRAYLETKDARIPDDRSDLRQARQATQAGIDFYEGYMLYLEGLGRGGESGGDLTKFPEAVNTLSDFEAKHGAAAADRMPLVQFVLGRSYVEMGQLDKAEEKYRLMQSAYPNDRNVAPLASAIFSAYDGQITALEQEVDSLAKGDDEDALDRAKKQLTDLRRKTIAIGLEYFDKSNDPQYGICFLTLQNLEALRDWERVETVGNRLVEAFGDKKNTKDKVDQYVRAIVGDAVLRQQKFRQAYDMLSKAEAADPKNYSLKRLVSLALGGWQEIDERGQVQRSFGLGKPAEAYDKYWKEYKIAGLNRNLVEPYSILWYRFHWELYHFARAAAENDSKFRDRARTVYSKAQSTDNFDQLKSLGLAGRDLRELFLENPPPR